MDLKILKEFIQLAKDEGVSELKYESKDQKLSVAFGGPAPSYQPCNLVRLSRSPMRLLQLKPPAMRGSMKLQALLWALFTPLLRRTSLPM